MGRLADVYASGFGSDELFGSGAWELREAVTDAPARGADARWVVGTETYVSGFGICHVQYLVPARMTVEWRAHSDGAEWDGEVLGPIGGTLILEDAEGTYACVLSEGSLEVLDIERTDRAGPSEGLRPRRGEPARPWRCHGHPIHATAPPWPFGAA